MCKRLAPLREPIDRSWDRKYPAQRIIDQERIMIIGNLAGGRIQELDERRNIWTPVSVIPYEPRSGIAPQCVAIGQSAFKCSHVKTLGSAALQKLAGKD